MSILITDSASSLRAHLRYNLEAIGYADIIESESTHSAIEQIKQNKVDMMFINSSTPQNCDIDFNDHSNLRKTLNYIRHSKIEVPIVIMTKEKSKMEKNKSLQKEHILFVSKVPNEFQIRKIMQNVFNHTKH